MRALLLLSALVTIACGDSPLSPSLATCWTQPIAATIQHADGSFTSTYEAPVQRPCRIPVGAEIVGRAHTRP